MTLVELAEALAKGYSTTSARIEAIKAIMAINSESAKAAIPLLLERSQDPVKQAPALVYQEKAREAVDILSKL